MPDAGILATLLLLVGLVLLVVEFFVPSGGLIGIIAAISLLASIWAAWKAWWISNPTFFWTYTGLWMVLIPGTLIGTIFLLEKTSLGDRILLRAPRPDEVAPKSDERDRLEGFVGSRAVAVTLLTPGGMVEIDGERIHSESEGMLIEPDTPVRVIGVVANRLRVRAIPADESAAARSDKADKTKPAIAESDAKSECPEESLAAERSNRPEPALADTMPTERSSAAASEGPVQRDPATPADSNQASRTGEPGEVLDFDIPQDYTAG